MRLSQLKAILTAKKFPNKMDILHSYTHLDVEGNKDKIKIARRELKKLQK